MEPIEYRDEFFSASPLIVPAVVLPVIFEQAATKQALNPERTPTEVSYGQLMALLAQRYLDRWCDPHGAWQVKLTQAQMAEQCFSWAEQSHLAGKELLARNLEAAAYQWQGWAEGDGEVVQERHPMVETSLRDTDDPELAFLQ